MPINEIFNFPQSSPGWDIIKSLSSYYGLKDYISVQYARHISSNKLRRIFAYRDSPYNPGDQYFWKEIFSGNLIESDKIELLNFQVSPWFPRKPGLFWTYDATKARRKAWDNHVEEIDPEKGIVTFDVYGKSLMSELGGIGCVNFRKNRNDVLLTATASGDTQRGIPIICNSSIWESIKAESKEDKKLEIDLTGSIEEIPREYDTYLLRSPGIPKIAVRVGSILNLKFKVSMSSINVTPWTIFETQYEHQPYGFTYINHDLFNDTIDSSIRWIKNYVDQHGGRTVITDFDEELNHLNSEFPLQGCMSGDITSESIKQYCQRMYYKFNRL